MKKHIACDIHKKCSVFVEMDETGKAGRPQRAEHGNAELEAYLSKVAPGTPIAIGASGAWHWMFDRIEALGWKPILAKAPKVHGQIKGSKKTDSGDTLGLAILFRNGTLPDVWVPNAWLLAGSVH